jgi:uncharacterized membrane protein
MAETNPYQAPQALVHDPAPIQGALAAEPQTVDAGRGIAWLAEGWALFRQAPGIWIAISVIAVVVFVLLAFIPFLGQLGSTLLSILFAGGIMLGCRDLDQGRELTVGHLFAGMQSHLTPLLVIGALYLAAVFALFLIAMLVGGGSFAAVMSGAANAGTALSGVLFIGLVLAALLVPVAMAMWFAPALATLNGVPAVEAMRASFRGCLRNLVPFIVYGIVLFILAMLASIPFGLGWLLLLPVMAGSVYAGYKDIFLQH